jgi:hypothetical protein
MSPPSCHLNRPLQRIVVAIYRTSIIDARGWARPAVGCGVVFETIVGPAERAPQSSKAFDMLELEGVDTASRLSPPFPGKAALVLPPIRHGMALMIPHFVQVTRGQNAGAPHDWHRWQSTAGERNP